MSTVVAVQGAPEIVCPEWCIVSQEQHLADLGEWEGFVIHTGEEPPCGENNTARVRFSRESYVDGTLATEDETQAPRVYVEAANDMTIEEADSLARAILSAVEKARGA